MNKLSLKNALSDIYDPDRLLRRFIYVSLVSWVLILLLLYWGVGAILERHTIKNAEKNSAYVGQELVRQNKAILVVAETGKLKSMIDGDAFGELDKKMRDILAPFNIVKIKVFTVNQSILYSTDESIIGEHDVDNPQLQAALAGQTVSILEADKTIADLSRRNRVDVQIIETYQPIVGTKGNIIGAFEMYYDVSDNLQDAEEISHSVVIAVAILLFLVFLAQAYMMLGSTQKLSQVQQGLKDMSQRDSLTGLFNRRHLEAALLREYASFHGLDSKNKYYHSGLLMIDLDYFKRINDEHGHLVGDEVLVTVSQRILDSTRDEDVVSRYGGEEFVVILPGSDMENTRKTAERIRSAIRDQPVDIDDQDYPVTVSVGVTSMSIQDRDPWNALERADKALYEAKADGRDRIVAS